MIREEIVNSMSLQDAIQVFRDTNAYGTMDIAKTVILKALEQEPCDYYDTDNKTCRRSEVPQEPCDDAISRKAIIDMTGLSEWFDSSDSYNEFVIALSELPSVTPQTRWIPVSKRLPEKMGTYLVTLEYKEHGKGVTTLWYHGKGIGWDLRVADVVTAWMPLPEPYKAESEE